MNPMILCNILRRAPLPWTHQLGSKATMYHLERIGKREVVGHGMNGTEIYYDRVAYPMPPVRFREPSPESKCLRAKEAKDWKLMSIEEKKALYRHSFCQTFAEFTAYSGEWRLIVGWACWAITGALFVAIIYQMYLYEPLPLTFDDEHQKAQLQRMLDMEVNPIFGLASKWDYKNNKWKSKN